MSRQLELDTPNRMNFSKCCLMAHGINCLVLLWMDGKKCCQLLFQMEKLQGMQCVRTVDNAQQHG